MLKPFYISCIIALLLCNLTFVYGQSEENVWDTLSDITFENIVDPASGIPIPQAQFGEDVLDLNGKEITVRGYLLPEKGYKTHKEFILSSLPYNLCYFCGKAGPETVMEVSSLDAIRYSDDPIVLKGVLMLNVLDPYGLPYILTNARLIR